MQDPEPGRKLGDLIKKAIQDCELTHTEFQQIVSLAHADHVIDEQHTDLGLLGNETRGVSAHDLTPQRVLGRDVGTLVLPATTRDQRASKKEQACC